MERTCAQGTNEPLIGSSRAFGIEQEHLVGLIPADVGAKPAYAWHVVQPHALQRALQAAGESPFVRDSFTRHGGRLYIDLEYLEHASPECSSPEEAVIHDRVGAQTIAGFAEHFLDAFGDLVGNEVGDDVRLRICKGSPGSRALRGGGVSPVGTHENYLVPCDTNRWVLEPAFTSFLATREVLVGAGGVVRNQSGDGRPVFHRSPRSHVIETQFTPMSLSKAPMVVLRDEHHADNRFNRLQVASGDANLFDDVAALKVGITHLALRLVEEAPDRIAHLGFDDPARVHRTTGGPVGRSGVQPLIELGGSGIHPADHQELFANEAARLLNRTGSTLPERQALGGWYAAIDEVRAGDTTLHSPLEWRAKQAYLETVRDPDDRDGRRLVNSAESLVDIAPGGMPDVWSTIVARHAVVDHARVASHIGVPQTRAALRARCALALTDWPFSVQLDWSSVAIGMGALHEPLSFEMGDPRFAVGATAQAFLDAIGERRAELELLARLHDVESGRSAVTEYQHV